MQIADYHKTDASRVPAALDEPLCSEYEARVLMAIRQMIRGVDIYSRQLNATSRITTPQAICLNVLLTQGRITLSTLTREVGLSASTVNGIVDRLEAKELVRRERDTKDRRKVFLELTPAGRERGANAPSLLQKRLSEALQALPLSEIEIITDSLERVAAMMEVAHLDASPNLMPGSEIKSEASNGTPP